MSLYLVSILLIIASICYIKIAEHFNIVDKPNHRSSHTKSTIRGGGILFFIALLLYYFFSGLNETYFVIGTSIIGLLSFVDDIHPLSPALRFPVQILAVALCLVQINFDLPIFIIFFLGIAGVAFINAFNFMDGINAITGFYSIVIIAGFLYYDAFIVDFINEKLLYYTLIALAVFGFYNFRKKAKFFAGDIGSITLAMVILYTAFMFYKTTQSPLVLLFLAVYGVDTLMTIFVRKRLKEKLSEAHRHHLYQKLVDNVKYSHMKVAAIYAIIQAVLICITITLYSLPIYSQWIVTVVILLLFVILYFLISAKTGNKNEI
ncbi:glycosyltransferase family 4 protein [uncultured Dokdonia sp.]|uniref:MraY family glycosyltransferase n=1 Tax=uncultured Dokdonia sp. TaxID=575653 RepID=UPI00263115CC|nr:glycosyltransferase family 4 protein [uncultured Dokdonia sp.]